jgi:hypothetical protein
MISEKFIYFGALLNLFGSLTYVKETIIGRTRPNRVSWFMWALAPLVAFAAEISKGVGLVALMTFMVGFGPLLVFIASFVNKKAVWKITQFDLLCGILSFLGLIFWLLTQEGNIAIVFAIVADTLAAIPTLFKSFKYPETESSIVFSVSAISALITLLTINNWTFAAFGFPLYIFVICTIFTLLIRFKLGKTLTRKFA